MKWKSKIEPLKFEKAKKEFIQDVEDLRIKSTFRFFELITAQIQKGIAKTNYANADTLYKIGMGRFQVGTVTQDELLKLELSLLNAEQALSMAQLEEKRAQASLNSFLGFEKNVEIECIVPSEIPELQINPDVGAFTSHTEQPGNDKPPAIEITAGPKCEADKIGNRIEHFAFCDCMDEADHRRNFLMFITQPDKSQRFSMGLNVPIVDWGRTKGRVSMAESNREVALATIKQERLDFEMDIFQSVMEFNLQAKPGKKFGKSRYSGAIGV